MPRPLRAPRYAEGASPSLIDIITSRLHFFSYTEAHEFYRDFVPHLKPNELALLGCNDRYFLLTGLLNRADALPPRQRPESAAWLYDRCREVEASPDGHIDLWARFHWKSSIISCAGVIQEVLIDPEIKVGIFSNTKGISQPFVAQIKEEFEGNEALHIYYSDVLWENARVEAPSWSVAGGLTVKRKGNPRECTVEAHGLIDAMPTGKHFSLLVYDDVINEKNVTNPEQIKKATERVQLSFNLGIGEGTRKWFIGTRYHYSDSYGWLLDPAHRIATPRIYPATDDGTLNGKPVFLSPEEWEKTKREQRSTIAAQMLQNPLAGQENTFHIKWLKAYWVRPALMNVYIVGDPSRGKSATSDRTAIAVIGIDTGGNKYVLDGYCHRMALSERWERLKELHKKWSTMHGVQHVKVAWERYGLQTDLEYFDEKMRAAGRRFEIEEVGWTGEAGRQSKEHRVERLEPDLRNGSFFIPAKVWYPLTAEDGTKTTVARWFLSDDDDKMHYRPDPGLHVEERRCKANGEIWRVFDPIRRLDEDGNIYDLTRVFVEEMIFFPFSPRDDLIDAVSRIYDLDPAPAVAFEKIEVEDYPDF